MMRVLVFGKTGQVATALQELKSNTLLVDARGRDEADLCDPESCARLIRESDADAVINAAAYTAVDDAEANEVLAETINADAPGAMAVAAAQKKVPFLHISTDYVFDGTGKAAFKPDQSTSPLNAYGRSKLKGEEQVRAAKGVHAILRTSWVYSPHGANFVKTMLRVGATRDELKVVADQIGGPTPASAIAEALLSIANALNYTPSKAGTYHFSGAPDTSWAEFAREIFAVAGMKVKVNECTSEEWPTPAPRPSNSRLDCSSTFDTFAIERPSWQADLKAEFSGKNT